MQYFKNLSENMKSRRRWLCERYLCPKRASFEEVFDLTKYRFLRDDHTMFYKSNFNRWLCSALPVGTGCKKAEYRTEAGRFQHIGN
ncbi:hypothetical protein VTP01DRAFT_5915 [Rhizomucor pusillus]|uniref:uncharacterized protein n=1 Tax=Rhizomucor pusillus TaxID=4840 RepID=UPI003744AB1E